MLLYVQKVLSIFIWKTSLTTRIRFLAFQSQSLSEKKSVLWTRITTNLRGVSSIVWWVFPFPPTAVRPHVGASTDLYRGQPYNTVWLPADILDNTVCPRSLGLWSIVSYYMRWGKATWTYSISYRRLSDFLARRRWDICDILYRIHMSESTRTLNIFFYLVP